MRDEDLTKNASQGSIIQQIFPLIPERFLSELTEPPLPKKRIHKSIALCRAWRPCMRGSRCVSANSQRRKASRSSSSARAFAHTT